MDDRRTLRSGLPVQLRREVEGLVGALIPLAEGRLRIERLLGHGTLFVTFAATRILRRGAMPVAVKVLRPSIAQAWPAGPRLLSSEQARLMVLLNERLPPCAHVVRLIEAGELPPDPARGLDLSVPFLAFELVPPPLDAADASLFTRVRLEVTTRGVALEPATALGVLRGVARGLDHVHGHGLVHRGLGPTNVLLSGDLARVSDVAVAWPTGLPFGFGVSTDTPAHTQEAYRAPEQRAAMVATPAFDIFAFAALGRFVLSGRPDRALTDPAGRATALHPALTSAAERGRLEAIDAILDEGLSIDPERRPATVLSLFERLAEPLAAVAGPARGRRATLAAPPTPGWVWSIRHDPKTPLRGVTRALCDADGRALLIAGATALFFDGRTYRPLALANLEVATAIAHREGLWVVLGRSPEGFGVGVALEAGEQRLLRRHRSVAVCATFLGERLAVVDGLGRLLLDDQPFATLSGMACAYAIAQLDAELAVVVGMGTGGAPLLLSVGLASGEVRTQPWPLRALGFSMARDARGDAVLVGCAHGLLVELRRAAGDRVVASQTQLPMSDDVRALVVDDSGVVLVGTRGALLARQPDGAFSPVHEDPALDELLAMAPRPRGCLLFTAAGLVVEGRDLNG